LKRYSFIVTVQLPFPFHVVRRAYGNNMSTRSFAFRVDPDSATNSTRILQESVRITSALPEYHTREQRRRVAEAMSSAGGKQRSNVIALYQVLTGDESAVPAKEFIDDLARAIDERVPMEYVAMTVQENERNRGGKFTDFFGVAKGILLNEAAVDDRRHGHQLYQTVMNSIKDLIQKVNANCAADGLDEPATPSEYWIRPQFCQSNPFAKTSARWSGLLGVSYKLQARQLSKTTIDAHYATKQYQLMKEWVIAYADKVVRICADDNSTIPVTDPGVY
jgi:hypothetical protein